VKFHRKGGTVFKGCLVTGSEGETKTEEFEGHKFTLRQLGTLDLSLALSCAQRKHPGLDNSDPLIQEEYSRHRILFSLGGHVMLYSGMEQSRKLGIEGWDLEGRDSGGGGNGLVLPVTIEAIENMNPTLYLKLLHAANELSGVPEPEAKN